MTRTLALIAAGSLLFGCKGKSSDDTDKGPVGDCTNGIVETFPADGASAVFYKTTVEATFQEVEADATITVTSGGTEVSGSTEWQGNRLVFTPNGALDPSASYDVEIGYSCGPASVSWGTSEVGSSTDANSLIGTTFSLDLASGRFVRPEGVGALLSTYLTVDVLIGITDAGNKLDMMGAIGAEGAQPPEQDFCTETIPFPVSADFSDNPFFSIGPSTTTLSVQGFDITIDDLLISGAFAPDGSYIAGAVLAGDIDVRQDALTQLLEGSTADDICGLVSTFGVACEECASDGEAYCLGIYVDNIDAEKVPSELVPLAADQLENNMCMDTCTNTDTAGEIDDDGDGVTNASEPECDSAWP